MSIADISTANLMLRKAPWTRGPAAGAEGAAVVTSLTDFQIEGFGNLVSSATWHAGASMSTRLGRKWSDAGREGRAGRRALELGAIVGYPLER